MILRVKGERGEGRITRIVEVELRLSDNEYRIFQLLITFKRYVDEIKCWAETYSIEVEE